MAKVVAGIDVSSRNLECRIAGYGKKLCFSNTSGGCLKILKNLKKLQVDLVVLEATGGYEKALVRALWAGQVDVAVLNPRWVRNFAKSEGRRAKNDRIDAALLLLYGERMDPTPSKPSSQEIERLRVLLTRREQLLDMLVAEKNHEKAPEMTSEVKRTIRSMRAMLTKQIKAMDSAIKDLINGSPAMKPRADKLTQQIGVGPVLTASLIADVPELGTVRRNVASALVGVAPFDRDSGNYTGKRSIGGGRARPRRALYMATLAAVRHDPYLKGFYKRLVSRGKPHKVALVACMRKFIIRLNTVLKEDPEQHFMAV